MFVQVIVSLNNIKKNIELLIIIKASFFIINVVILPPPNSISWCVYIH